MEDIDSKNGYECGENGCNKTFTRKDSLDRHMTAHEDTRKRFPCTLCSRYGGSNGFTRKDHLAQHMRGYHRLTSTEKVVSKPCCPHAGCMVDSSASNDPRTNLTFETLDMYQAHMRKVHKETPFHCHAPGCDRIGPRGWFREFDLIKHRIEKPS